MKFYLFFLVVLLLSSCGSGNEGAAGMVLTPAVEPPAQMVTDEPDSKVTRMTTREVVTPPVMTPAASSTPVPATPAPPTATVQPQVLTFAVVGDYGTNGAGSQEVAALVNSWDPDLVLTVGDNNYPDGAAETIQANIEQHYGRFIDENRFFPTLGNHDMTTDDGRPYLEYFQLPGNERYYDFVQGDVHFFALNSDWREADGIGAGSRQAQWLQERLAASTTSWQVVYFHAAPYVSMEAKEVPVMRWPFAQWGADLVLAGHAHLYERLHIEGIPYLVNGLGGGGIYAFDEAAVPGSEFRFNDNYGALLFEATKSQLSVQFVTRTGAVIDQITLYR